MGKSSLPSRLLFTTVLLITGLLSVTNGYSQYCTTGLYSSGCAAFSDQINSFSTTGGSSNITNTNSGCSPGSYNHFSMTHSTLQGTQVDFSVTNGPGGGAGIKIWVDFDDNQVFDDATELMWASTGTIAANATATGNFTIPFSVTAGVKRMRVRHVFGTATFTACSNTHTWGEVEDYNLEVIAATACSGTPTGGSATSTITSLCTSNTPFTLNVTGATNASGLTYQWEFSLDNISWSPIPGATNSTLTVNSTGSSTYYRRKITCGANSAWSSSVLITLNGASYATLPFTESFENTWVDRCDTRDVPNNFWRNTPATGNNSWRRDDDPASAAWVNPNLGAYTPTASAGVNSARFHSYQAANGTKGRFDLYVNANTPDVTKRLSFDFINTSGNDSLVVFVSTNGGSSFTRVDSVRTAAAWRNKVMLFNSTSATTVIRFEATSDFGVTDIGLDNISVTNYPNCTGTPTGGTVAASLTTVCSPATQVTFTVTGATDAGALTYQWQSSPDNITWTNIAGATGISYTGSGITANTYFRRLITCAGNTTPSTSVQITIPPVSYGTLPFTESFENTWIDKCGTRDVPNNFWRNNPSSGNNSWRRDDDAVSAGWVNPTFGAYTPTSSAGAFSARFHSYQASSGSKGLFDLYINANTPDATKRLSFDFINTSGNDSLVVRLSTDGGATFVRLDSVRTATAWRTKQIVFTSTSATTVIRFDATSDFGVTDIGLDNISIVNFPACSGTPVAGTTNSSAATVCPGTPFNLSVTGATDASGLTYQWQISTNGGTSWSNTAGATAATYTSAGITVPTSYRRQIICGANSSFSTQVDVAMNAPAYAPMPYFESFEATWINGCNTRDIPNNFWRNNPLTGNNSWRREDDPASAGWVNPNLGMYTPAASLGDHSARFHSYQATSGTQGRLDLHLNANTAASNKRLQFDFINTSGNDSLVVFLSTNGGTSFTRLDSVRTATAWRTKSIIFNSSSATTIIRFQATSDFGVTDIGLDNISVIDFADCSGTPTAGTATATPSTVCVEPFTLSLTGSATAAGLSYQWQSSPDNVTWTNIPGATNFNQTLTQVGTTWYRAVVTCSFSSVSSNSTSVQVISPSPVSGVFTIDNSFVATNPAAGEFKSFNDAYQYIKCGINGPVLFNVKTGTGPYNEQLIMNPIPGASPVNTVTFRGNGVSEITFASGNTNERATIKLRGADYIIFDSLVISATGTFSYGVQLMPNSDSNVIKRSVINTSTTLTTNAAGIVINATDVGPIATGNVFADGNKIDSNVINGGQYGITLVATTAGANGNNRIRGNTITNFYQYGIYAAGSYGTLIDSNSISRPTRTGVTDFNGIHLTGVHVNAMISKNRIFNPFGGAPASTSAFTGIHLTGVDATAGNDNWIANNAIYNVNGNGAQTGIANTSSDNVYYVHNTVALDDATSTSTATTRGFFQTTVAGGLIIYDNMITIRRGGTGQKHAIYMATATTGFIADYNNYLVNSAGGSNFVGFSGGASRATLTDWQSATGQDANSYSRDPFYTNASAGNLKPTNGAIDNKGFYANVPTDIVGEVRNTSTPDIGAWEFTSPPCTLPPVSGNTWFSDSTVCQLSLVRLNSTLTSWGATQTFQWERSITGAAPWVAFGNQLSDPDTTINADTTMFYRLAVTCAATTVYSNPVQMIVSPALPAGTYTINPTGTTYIPGIAGGNFNSFADAKFAMGCGILGPVVFNVVPGSGPYTEQLVLDPIANASAVNTITFNGNLNTLQYSPNATEGNQRAVIKLNGADHITFDSLIINATGGTFGYGVQLIADADSNTFTNNQIITSTTDATTNFAGVVINASHNGAITTGITRSDANVFDNNTITGGYYGVTLVGSTTVADYLNNNRFTNNTIREFYNYGMYVGGTSNTLIQSNTITRPTRANSATSVYGIGLTGAINTTLRIDKNRFTNFFGGALSTTNTTYGIHHNSIDANVGNENLITNNLFYNLNGNGPVYALYNIGSNNVWYQHNTISLDDNASTAIGQTAALYQTTVATGIHFENNIVTISRTGTGPKYGIYMAASTSEITSNYNDFYITATNGHTGFRTTNQTSLAQWRAASLQDANSVSLNPLYIDPAAGNYKPQLGAIDNMGIPVGVTSDILNQPRSATTPDIGAYEFSPTPCTVPPVPGVATVVPNAGICLESPVDLDITGHSALGSLTFQWQASPDGTSGWVNISPVQFFPQFTHNMTTNTYFRAAVTCSGTTVYTNVVNVVLNPILLSGTYTINGGSATTYLPGMTSGNFNTFQEAVNAMQCGIGGPVVFNVAAGTYNEKINIPYIRNTNSTNTVTFQSATGVASSVNLTAAGTSTDNYTLRLDSTRWFTFRNMTFTGTDASYGRVIELIDSASNNTLVGNVINMPVVSVSNNNVSGIFMNAYKGVNITIKGNTVNNGSHGIHLTGTAITNLAKVGHVIDSNTVIGSYTSGIYTQYTKRLPIRGNTVTFNTPVQLDAVAIYANYADTAFRITGNTVNIGNTSNSVYGIRVTNSRSVPGDSSILHANKVIAGANNTGTVYGISIGTSKEINVVNNTIAISSAGATAYGLHHLNNTSDINYYNNTANVTSSGATNYAAWFSNGAIGNFEVYNNVFSNKGGGRALYVNNPSFFSADYNMLYATGTNLVQVNTGTVLNFPTLKDWILTWNWDQSSISHTPRFVSETDLRPDLGHAEVWAMHGRGVQIRGNNYDINNVYRPDSLTAGVPDLGAYEFFPTVEPAALLASGAPAPNTTQVFSFGTDTVMRITWGPTAPPSVTVRRYSGVVPSGLVPGTDSMFFYTKVEVGGGSNNYNYGAKLYYVDSWRGSIPEEWMIGLGRTTPSNAWVVGQNSTVDVAKNEIRQEAMIYMDRFTGLVNVWAQPDFDDSSSNRGKDFWVGYQRSNAFSEGNSQQMVLYFGAGDTPANVTVTIEGTTGTPWVRNYLVPANSALASDFMPKAGADDARLVNAGLYDNKGIHIESDVPIVVYGHIYSNTNSGATMLMPTPTWGYEYYVLTSMQQYTNVSYSAFHFVAQKDSTWVEVNPSNPTQNGMIPNGGTQPNGSYLIKLNKGDVYQVLGNIQSGSIGYDMTGSYVKSISNAQGECHPIAVFSGSTRTSVYCVGNPWDGDNGELIIQQIFPYQAWGTKYLTAPTSLHTGPNATSNMTNMYRVMVKDPTTVVKRNGVTIPVAQLQFGRYYHFNSNQGDLIEANKPIMVAQFEGSSLGACAGNTTGIGDGEMFYLSPLEQAVKKSQFYRNTAFDIDYNFITVIIPTEGLSTLRIDGVNYLAYPATERYASAHPNMPGYSIVTKRWLAGSGSGTVSSDHPFTGIVYGSGGAESYGYNIGTLVKNLNNLGTVNNTFNTGVNPTEYTCKGAPFNVTALLPLVPDSLEFLFNLVPKLTPATNVKLINPTPVDTVTVNGVDYYAFTISQSYVIDSAGTFQIPIQFWDPEIESCDKRKAGALFVQVLPKPLTDFSISYSSGNPQGCEGDVATFTGNIITANGIALNQWQWTFHDATTANGQVQTKTFNTAGTFDVKLRGITADGCLADTTKQVVINAKPVVTVAQDNVSTCPNQNATFTISSPIAGATYQWYDAATGGTLLHTGTSFTVSSPTLPVNYYVQAIANGCPSLGRKQVTLSQFAALTPAVVTVTASTATSITFSWTAVPGAVSYEVSVNGGPFVAATGTSHTVSGLGTLQSRSIVVRAVGTNSCQVSLSAAVSGCTNSAASVAPVTQEICKGAGATFNVQSPEAGITYSWFTTATGGTALATGTSYTHPNVQNPTDLYVEQSNTATGCVSTTRTKVSITLRPDLAVPVVTADSISINAIRFSWAPVPGATGYQVSLDNGVTWIAPSGPGLVHWRTGLLPSQEVTIKVRAIGPCGNTEGSRTARSLPDKIFVPNSFSPNGDGLNDRLLAYGYGVQTIQFAVFNQWGEKVFETNNQQTGWDGTYKGKAQPSGVYMYVCKAVLTDGTKLEMKGSINLIR